MKDKAMERQGYVMLWSNLQIGRAPTLRFEFLQSISYGMTSFFSRDDIKVFKASEALNIS